MTLEEEIFNNFIIDKDKLINYGFKLKKDKLIFEKKLSKDDFKAIFEFDDKLSGKIFDLSTNDEYINFRIENLSGFSSEIREEYTNLLIDIRNKCSKKEWQLFAQAKRISKYIEEKYKDLPEFLWEKFPNYAIYRKKENKKWYALFGAVNLLKIDKKSKSKDIVEIINIKVNKEETQNLIKQKGIFEAYHMNKKSWVTIILDDTLEDIEIKNLIDKSYQNA